MTDALPRRFIDVSAPTLLAAIGEALCKAFGRPARSETLEKVIAKLDRD